MEMETESDMSDSLNDWKKPIKKLTNAFMLSDEDHSLELLFADINKFLVKKKILQEQSVKQHIFRQERWLHQKRKQLHPYYEFMHNRGYNIWSLDRRNKIMLKDSELNHAVNTKCLGMDWYQLDQRTDQSFIDQTTERLIRESMLHMYYKYKSKSLDLQSDYDMMNAAYGIPRLPYQTLESRAVKNSQITYDSGRPLLFKNSINHPYAASDGYFRNPPNGEFQHGHISMLELRKFDPNKSYPKSIQNQLLDSKQPHTVYHRMNEKPVSCFPTSTLPYSLCAGPSKATESSSLLDLRQPQMHNPASGSIHTQLPNDTEQGLLLDVSDPHKPSSCRYDKPVGHLLADSPNATEVGQFLEPRQPQQVSLLKNDCEVHRKLCVDLPIAPEPDSQSLFAPACINISSISQDTIPDWNDLNHYPNSMQQR